MEQRNLDRLGMVAGGLAWLAVGIPVAVNQFSGDGSLIGGSTGWWWTAFLAYGVVFALSDNPRFDDPLWLRLALLAAQVLLGLTVFALAPAWGFTAVLLVCSAAAAAYVLGLRGAMILVAAQTLATAALLLDVTEPAFVVTQALVYGGFQAFAVLMVEAGLREARARQDLAEVNAELQATQALLAESTRSSERLRIARDLHDLVGHQLTALTLNLEAAAHHAEGAAKDHVERSRTAAKALLGDVREVVSQLREPEADLATELQAITGGMTQPVIHLRLTPGLDISEPEQARTLIRCVQEVVTNAVRHAAAENLWIQVVPESGGTSLRAWDDGCGTASIRPGNGLAGMRERFEQLGGRVSFVSGAGQGFRVEATLPLRRRSRAPTASS